MLIILWIKFCKKKVFVARLLLKIKYILRYGESICFKRKSVSEIKKD